MKWWTKIIAAVIILLCLCVACYPYVINQSKIGSGWTSWDFYTRVFVIEQTIIVAIPEIAAFRLGLWVLARTKRPFVGYALLVIAPMLGMVAFILCTAFM